MANWQIENLAATDGGRMQLIIAKVDRGGRMRDVTYFRGAPTEVARYTSGDPFGDSVAEFVFPSITVFDDLDSIDVGTWLGNGSNVDLRWIPGPLGDARPARTLWEGFVASLDWVDGEDSQVLRVQCQGANFQLDRYLQKPFYPQRPYPLERLIADAFDHTRRPHLRTQPLRTDWPDGWAKVVPPYTGNPTLYTPVATPGSRWSGYTSRSTGAWDRALTGFVQDQIAVMLTDDDSGVAPGNQWTVLHERSVNGSPGRQPVLRVRDRHRAPDFAIWAGTPGFTINTSSDSTQSNNIVYGDGTGLDGTVWRNAVIANDGSRTDYLPLAADRNIWPFINNPGLGLGALATEGYLKFGPGFGQDQATSSARKQLARDHQAGWTGSATLKVDPSVELSRWEIQAGWTVLVKGFLGSGEDGVAFHIAAVEARPHTGTVTLTLDTRYRDLLSIEEALVRTRDPLTPSKALQINRASAVIEDIQAPWDYTAGSGYLPKAGKAFYDSCPASLPYPYLDWAHKHPPLHYPGWYVRCNANANTRAARWAGPIPILTSEKGTIRRTEFFAVSLNGFQLRVPFHVSLYYVNVNASFMPRDGGGPSAFLDGAFESVNPLTGQPWPAGNFLAPDPSLIIGWGNRARGVYQRAGFSPAREADGAVATGRLVDEGSWSFDNTNNPNYNRQAKPGQSQTASAVTIYAMFYCEADQPAFFSGRLFRQNQGA